MAKTAKAKLIPTATTATTTHSLHQPHAVLGAGITKPPHNNASSSSIIQSKSSKSRKASRAQRLRHERGLARAEIVQDQMQVKVGRAAGREGRRKARRKVWEEVNGDAVLEMVKAVEKSLGDNGKQPTQLLATEEEMADGDAAGERRVGADAEMDGWEDEEDEEEVEEEGRVTANGVLGDVAGPAGTRGEEENTSGATPVAVVDALPAAQKLDVDVDAVEEEEEEEDEIT